MQLVDTLDNGAKIFIDYAHTPDALKNILQQKNYNMRPNIIFGCGGNRDAGKRPIMGKTAYLNSDISIFTSDNPRYEIVDDIIFDMASGILEDVNKKLIFIHDRYEAILKATELAQKGDIILILGKGHEDYQEIQGEKKPFDDYKILTKILN